MKKIFYIIISVVLILFTACSSSEETTQKQADESEPEIYVFDDVTESVPDTTKSEEEPIKETLPQNDISEQSSPQFLVQVGAFTTKERADNFVSENSSKTTYPLNITFSESVKLYVVQLPGFSTRQEAEQVRNQFWSSGLFKDAFIVTK